MENKENSIIEFPFKVTEEQLNDFDKLFDLRLTQALNKLDDSKKDKFFIDLGNIIDDKYKTKKIETFVKNYPEIESFTNSFKYIYELMKADPPQQIEKNYKKFMLTSKETDFEKYSNKLLYDSTNKIVKTEIIEIENNNTRKGQIISKGNIKCCLFSPLDWLNNTYKLTTKDVISTNEIITKITALKFFNLSHEEKNFFEAVCYLIKRKKYNNKIYITYQEIHTQLGYKEKLRECHKQKYKNMLYKLENLRIEIDMKEARNSKYKKFYSIQENIKEALLIKTADKFIKAKNGKRTILLEGFETVRTNLMDLHFNYTNHFYIEDVKPKKLQHNQGEQQEALLKYIEKMYFLQKKNTKQEFTQIGVNTICEKLKEFDFEKKMNKAKESRNLARFMNRHIYDVIEKHEKVDKVTKDYKHDNIIIVWKDENKK